MKTVSFRRFPLLVIFALVPGLLPCSAQTLVSGVVPADLRPGTEVTPNVVTLDHESNQSADGFTNDQRLDWFVQNTVAPRGLGAGAAGAAVGIGLNGAHRHGGLGQDFTRRFETHLADTVTANAMEATLGAIRREDPRYYLVPAKPFGGRARNVIRMTFEAYHSHGESNSCFSFPFTRSSHEPSRLRLLTLALVALRIHRCRRADNA